MTSTLSSQTFWAGYNRPHFPEIKAAAGYLALAAQHAAAGHDEAAAYINDETYTRAKIFARDHVKVRQKAELKIDWKQSRAFSSVVRCCLHFHLSRSYLSRCVLCIVGEGYSVICRVVDTESSSIGSFAREMPR